MYRIAICDDEPVFLRAHEKMADEILTQAGICHQITSFPSAGALREALAVQPAAFDILLLDILLQAENGLELARLLRKDGNDISILFITSSPDFSLEGYDVSPVHYLLKPLQKEKLAQVLVKDYGRNRRQKTIVFPIKGGRSGIALDAIMYIEILNRQVIVHADGRQILTLCPTLLSAGKLAPAGQIIQCHKSYLVNLKNIKDITKTNILLRDGENIPVGRAFHQETLAAFVESISYK